VTAPALSVFSESQEDEINFLLLYHDINDQHIPLHTDLREKLAIILKGSSSTLRYLLIFGYKRGSIEECKL
jgi:hypothetical protein